MPRVKPFRGVRPPKALVEQVESRPYDVLDSEEARAEAGANEKSLYHIIKPEINFEPGCSEYDERCYSEGAAQFAKFQKEGWLVQDEEENYYLYAQTMNGKTQYGIVVCCHTDDYMQGRIKKHELTRRDKEDDRMRHVRETNANVEPVFLAFKHNQVLLDMISKYAAKEPVYDFIAPIDGFGHKFWVIADKADQAIITEEFGKMDAMYIADGHHRSAAAARVGAEKAAQNPNNTGDEEYNFYMAVRFPAEQLTILVYNRVVKDLKGKTSEEFLAAIAEDFDVECKGAEEYQPQVMHEFALYLDGMWYSLKAHDDVFDATDPIGVLDVDISSRLILQKQLEIGDLRSSQRIDFVGGLRGLGELKRRVDSGEMKMALALYPVSMDQIINIADSGNIMPPKATWFEPKLRSGLIIHKLS
ncbi:MAG: DUF1015 domain-containing protein [Bacteroidales bacterium]|nr:DUF1015 domain-containing protein [Candidatus Equimonas enterica]